MADHSLIEWTDATWNPITGCSVVSPGCTNCYAMKLAGTRLQHHESREGLTRNSKAGPVWTGEVRFNEQWLDQPLRWKKPRRIFVCAHGDLFAENVPDEWIDRVFAVMALANWHTYQVLTKRPARARAYMAERSGKLARFMIDEYLAKAPDTAAKGKAINIAWPVKSVGDIDMPDDVEMCHWPLPNVWLGVSVEDQTRANERIPDLLATPAAVRFISAEPLLGPIDLCRLSLGAATTSGGDLAGYRVEFTLDALRGAPNTGIPGIDWVIVGGESGPRPTHPGWVRKLRNQCQATGAAFFFKQWGSWAPGEWAFDLDDHLQFHPDDDRVPVRGLGDHDRAQERMIWSEGNLTPEGRGYLNVGKKAAGRMLDGVEHNAMPEVRR